MVKKLLLVVLLMSCPVWAAVDSTSAATPALAASLTWPHTVGTGANRLLIVTSESPNANGTLGAHTGDATSVTYGGVALTEAVGGTETGDGNCASIWYLVAPASGTANIVVTLNGTVTAENTTAEAVSLTGMAQTSTLDIADATSTYTSNAFSLTDTVAANTWIVAACAQGFTTFVSWGNGDTDLGIVAHTRSGYNGPKSGSQTESINLTGFTQGIFVVASFKPSSGAAACTASIALTGAGCK
jgi:hypothetical protein